MKSWKTIKSKYLIQDKWITLRSDTCKTPEGITIAPYYVLEYPDWAHIVAIDSNNQLMITHQYRHAVGKICSEIPCGVIEKDEAPIDAARRELEEETGCTANQFTKIGNLYPNPATHNNEIHCFLARDLSFTKKPNPDPTENITFQFETISDILKMIENNSFSQALHVASLMLAFRYMNLIKI
jgi:8-oxo-dGTP pyrophosphatase MutT (NUDIX family)